MNSDKCLEVSARIRDTRKSQGLSQSALAKRTDTFHQSDIAKIEKAFPPHTSASRLVQLASALGVSLSYLLDGGEVTPTTNPDDINERYQANYASLAALDSSTGNPLAVLAYALAERDVALEALGRRIDSLTIRLSRERAPAAVESATPPAQPAYVPPTVEPGQTFGGFPAPTPLESKPPKESFFGAYGQAKENP